MIVVINSTSRAPPLLPPLQSRAREEKSYPVEGLVCEKAVRLKIPSGSRRLAKV